MSRRGWRLWNGGDQGAGPCSLWFCPTCAGVFTAATKLAEFWFSKTSPNHIFSIENTWGIAQSDVIGKYTDYSDAELMFVEKTRLFLMVLDFTLTEKRPFVWKKVESGVCTKLSKLLWGSHWRSWPNFAILLRTVFFSMSPITLTVIRLLIVNKRSKIRPSITGTLDERCINGVQSVYINVRLKGGLCNECSCPFVAGPIAC